MGNIRSKIEIISNSAQIGIIVSDGIIIIIEDKIKLPWERYKMIIKAFQGSRALEGFFLFLKKKEITWHKKLL